LGTLNGAGGVPSFKFDVPGESGWKVTFTPVLPDVKTAGFVIVPTAGFELESGTLIGESPGFSSYPYPMYAPDVASKTVVFTVPEFGAEYVVVVKLPLYGLKMKPLGSTVLVPVPVVYPAAATVIIAVPWVWPCT